MKHSEPIGPPSRTTHVVAVGTGAEDVEVDVGTIGSTGMRVHPPSSPQLDGASSARFSCVGAGGGAPGQPQTSGCSSHKMLVHVPALGPLSKQTSPIGTAPR